MGYIHGDVHLHNALYIENYDYIQNYRVYLIDFGKTAPLESSTIINLNRQQIDCIRIMHTNNAVESVEGDIVVRGGYSTEVLQSGNSISISASVGAGELGQYEGYQIQ